MMVCDVCNIMEPDYACRGKNCSCGDNWGEDFMICEDCFKTHPDIVKEHGFK